MYRLPAHILNALKSHCFLNALSYGEPCFGVVEQILADLGYIETCMSEGTFSNLYTVSVSPKGRGAMLDNLNSPEVIALIQAGVGIGSAESAALLVIGVSKKFLPELLASGCRAVREAAMKRLDRPNGLERRTA